MQQPASSKVLRSSAGFWSLSAALLGLILAASTMGFIPSPPPAPADNCFNNTNIKSIEPPELQPCGQAQCDQTVELELCTVATVDHGSQTFMFCACSSTPPFPDSIPCMAVLRNDHVVGWGPACVGDCTAPNDCKPDTTPPPGYTYFCECR